MAKKTNSGKNFGPVIWGERSGSRVAAQRGGTGAMTVESGGGFRTPMRGVTASRPGMAPMPQRWSPPTAAGGGAYKRPGRPAPRMGQATGFSPIRQGLPSPFHRMPGPSMPAPGMGMRPQPGSGRRPQATELQPRRGSTVRG